MSLQDNEVKRLGSFPAWVLFRFLLPCIWLPSAIDTGSLFVSVMFLIAIFGISWKDYAHAYGFADEKGITFRRFFRKYCVTWDDVSRVDWSSSRMMRPYVVMTLEHRVGFFRTVKFLVTDKTYRWGQPPREDWVPEILPWMMNQLRMNQPPST